MDKIILICLSLSIVILIAAGCSAQRHLSWENGYLVLDNELQPDPFRSEDANILKIHLNTTDKNANIFIKLSNNPTTRSFVSELPMMLNFQKYGESEQISYLNTKLDINSTSQGITPHRGDLCYYAPWGNLALFRQDGTFSHGLIKIGEVQEGMEYIDILDTASSISVDLSD